MPAVALPKVVYLSGEALCDMVAPDVRPFVRCHGLYSTADNTVYLANDMPPDQVWPVTVHEFVHVLQQHHRGDAWETMQWIGRELEAQAAEPLSAQCAR